MNYQFINGDAGAMSEIVCDLVPVMRVIVIIREREEGDRNDPLRGDLDRPGTRWQSGFVYRASEKEARFNVIRTRDQNLLLHHRLCLDNRMN